MATFNDDINMLPDTTETEPDGDGVVAGSGTELAVPLWYNAPAGRSRTSGLLRSSALAAAIMLHAGLLYAITNAPNDMAGDGGTELGAIAVTIVSSKVLEARLLKSAVATARTSASVSATAGGSTISSAAISPPAGAKPQRSAAKPVSVRRPKSQPVQKAATDPAKANPRATDAEPQPPVKTAAAQQSRKGAGTVLATRSPATDKAPPEPKTTAKTSPKPPGPTSAETEPLKVPKPRRVRRATRSADAAPASTPSAAAVKGGASARSRQASARQTAGAAAASPGARNAFAIKLRKALNASPPEVTYRPGDSGGEVTVMFALTPAGKLRFARIKTSSGKAYLDQAALRAVRKAALPRPPKAMTPAQLTYELPFKFGR